MAENIRLAPPAITPDQHASERRRPHPYPASRWIAAGLLALAGVALVCYVGAIRLIEERLKSGPYPDTANIFSAPEMLVAGDESTPARIAARLRKAGFSESPQNQMGWYRTGAAEIEIHSGPAAYSGPRSVKVRFEHLRVARIARPDGTALESCYLEPQLLANINEQNGEKRRITSFREIPPSLVHAIISAEDKRFFRHRGLDLARIAKAAWVDLREGRKQQGASTLTMQLARNLWLERSKTWRRKAAEIILALSLEQKLSKEQIFEYYFNQVYLGRQGPFSVHGFAEAARTYFYKDLQHLTLAESALLAGIVQRPSYWNPFRSPERARERRNVVLGLMRENGFIDAGQYERTAAEPVNLKRGGTAAADAPYFLQLVNGEIQERIPEDQQAQQMSVYTTLDPQLQRDAVEAVTAGMKEVDAQLRRRKAGALPQVALVALDPATGQVKALTGGRDYSASQLNRALARRQPGSVFKPFVYAAALESALRSDRERIFTPASSIADEKTTFWFEGRPYEPGNFKESFHGQVTLRRALALSMNSATVRLAELVGYGNVADLARRAGLNATRATPALALGAYEATPLDVAGAYTVFANRGVYIRPEVIVEARGVNGTTLNAGRPDRRPVLDERIAYLMTDMLEDVIRRGTGAAVRARGFDLPAAGKTGTSRDGWFAGFTSKLLCVVWVGFDDNRDLGIQGSRAALPIWVEFMKRAHKHGAYRDAKPFPKPEGIVRATIDPTTGLLATMYCPESRTEVFLDGTQPGTLCTRHEPPPLPQFDLAGAELPAFGSLPSAPGSDAPSGGQSAETQPPQHP